MEGFTLGQDRVVGGVPRHPESLSDTGDGQVLTHDAFQCPPQATARQLRARLSRPAGVLAPHMTAAGAAIAADRDLQHRGTPTQRFMCQPPHHGVARHALASAAAAPLVGFDDPAGQHRTGRLKTLPNDFKSEFFNATERGQVRASEGSVRHVEVFLMGGVRTPIIGRPRLLPSDRRANPPYTLNCEEPV